MGSEKISDVERQLSAIKGNLRNFENNYQKKIFEIEDFWQKRYNEA